MCIFLCLSIYEIVHFNYLYLLPYKTETLSTKKDETSYLFQISWDHTLQTTATSTSQTNSNIQFLQKDI